MNWTDEVVADAEITGLAVCTTTDIKPFNLATMLVTRSLKVHMFPVWRVWTPESGFDLVYYEMQFKSGMVGPRSLRRAQEWSTAKPWRRLHIRWLEGLTPAQCRAALDRNADLKRRLRGYGKSQLLAKWTCERFGWPLENDDTLLDCSEHTARVVYAADPFWDLRDERRREFDAVTPGSGWRKLILRLPG
ncbi:MAG: hypothetical protein M0R74_09090 [Dehalococcoidia bacterium]|nr:hypothetical protein [Dehalococcoidia bacterium]